MASRFQHAIRWSVGRAGVAGALALTLALAACSNLLGIEDLHEEPAPGGGDSGSQSASGSGGLGAQGGRAATAGTSGRGQAGNSTGGAAGGQATGGSAAGGSAAAGAAGELSDAGAFGGAGAPPVVGTTVHGHVIDFWGHQLSGVPVEIGGTLTTTDGTGAFTISGVAAQYDASLVVEFPDNYDGQIYGWVFQGLTRRDPTLQVYAGLVRQTADVSVTPAHADVTLTDGRTQSVSFGGPDGDFDFTEVGALGYSQASVTWRGPISTQEMVHGLIFAQDPTSHLPTGYFAYDVKPIALNAAASATSPVTLDMSAKTIPSGNIIGSVTPAGIGARANQVFLRFTSNASIELVNDNGPDTFTYNVPTISDSSVTFAASEGTAFYGAYAVAHQDALAPGAAGVMATIPKPSSHLALTPASAINKVDANTQFSFQADASAGSLFVVTFENADTSALKMDGLFIVTTKNTFKLPKVTNDGFALLPSKSYLWRVETHGTSLADTDAAAGPTGFLDSFSNDQGSPKGPRRGSGSYTISNYSDKITMAP